MSIKDMQRYAALQRQGDSMLPERIVFPQNDVRTDPWSRGHFFTPTLDQLDATREILTSDGRTRVQGALAWIWGRSEKTIPIPGFKTVAQVEENAKAMEFGPLIAEQMRE